VRRCVLVLVLAAFAGGCPLPLPNAPVPPAVLPAEVRLHPFTGTREFSEAGGLSGIEARVEAMDHFGDPNKAFGTFRFEVYRYRPHQADPKGRRLAPWTIDLTDPQMNMKHWDSLSRQYKFHLHWNEPIPVGQRFILRVVFSPVSGPRLFDEIELVSGQ